MLQKVVADSFHIFDKDGNGFISAHELRVLLRDIEGEDIPFSDIEAMISLGTSIHMCVYKQNTESRRSIFLPFDILLL